MDKCDGSNRALLTFEESPIPLVEPKVEICIIGGREKFEIPIPIEIPDR